MRLAVLVLLLATGAAATAAPTPPKCSAAVVIDKVATGDVTGKIAALAPVALGTQVTVDKLAFRYVSDLPLPFKLGDTIRITYRCGGPPPGLYCDAMIADAGGRVLAIAAQNGTDDFSDGWTAKPGKVVEARQNPNESRHAVERTHALVLTRGKTSATVTGSACTAIEDGATTWYATGAAHSWDGVRPPDGIDYRVYSLVRAN